ncbi:MAG: hypothetical protein WDM70_08785 [Nitrosomonadales bacterium]
MQHKSWLDQLLDPLADKLDEWIAIMCTKEFWGIVAVGTTVTAFVIAAIIMLTNFSIMRMRNCFNASNLNAYLMFNLLLFFVFGGMLALGEAFNFFDNKKRGIPHKRGGMFWFTLITTSLGSVELIMLKVSC